MGDGLISCLYLLTEARDHWSRSVPVEKLSAVDLASERQTSITAQRNPLAGDATAVPKKSGYLLAVCQPEAACARLRSSVLVANEPKVRSRPLEHPDSTKTVTSSIMEGCESKGVKGSLSHAICE